MSSFPSAGTTTGATAIRLSPLLHQTQQASSLLTQLHENQRTFITGDYSPETLQGLPQRKCTDWPWKEIKGSVNIRQYLKCYNCKLRDDQHLEKIQRILSITSHLNTSTCFYAESPEAVLSYITFMYTQTCISGTNLRAHGRQWYRCSADLLNYIKHTKYLKKQKTTPTWSATTLILGNFTCKVEVPALEVIHIRN